MEELDPHRSFGEITFESPLPPLPFDSKKVDHCKVLRDGIVGAYAKFSSPFGDKPIIYNDWTASGRGLVSVENYIMSEVLPMYGNTHTTSSVTGHQSTCFRHEARQIVAEMTNAKITGKASQDLVLFCGNGSTGAVAKLVAALGLQAPLDLPPDDPLRPIVFVSKMEHHSNILPWRESCASVVEIDFDSENGISMNDLEQKLFQYANHKIKIGTFSAASNVTGQLIDVDVVSILLHRHGALAFFDYATAAPYVRMDMNPVYDDPALTALAAKDAIFFSGHKFLGGPGCPGVLVVKKMVLPQAEEAPSCGVGGGTVFYVTSDHHRFLSNREEREEAGTPHIVGDIRLGLICHMKRLLGADWIERCELQISQTVAQKLRKDERIVLLGRSAHAQKYLPIFAFLIRCSDRFLHYHFVCALLNDLFGIQSRGGCMCAGPYAQALLGLDEEKNNLFEAALLDKHEVLRPGFTRLSFPYWLSEEEINYVVDAVLFIAEHGWKFLPSYRFNPKTGEWAHQSRLTRFPDRKWISNFSFERSDSPSFESCAHILQRDWATTSHQDVLELVKTQVRSELTAAENMITKLSKESSEAKQELLHEMDGLRWFLMLKDLKERAYQAEILPISGPIAPNFLTVTGKKESNATAVLTAYAQQRDVKIAKRGINDACIPRFLSLFSNKDDSALLDILHENLTKIRGPLKTKTESASVAVSATSVVVDNKSSPSLKSPPPECDVSCTLPRQLPDGKTASGPGNYFPADPSVYGKFATPPKKIMKLVGQAVKDWKMIEDGDKILLGLSGGKDSLALLHILKALQKRAPVKFEIACATVDPQTSSFDPSRLIPYVRSLGVTYHYLSEPIVDLAKSKMQGDSLCAFCSRFKRGLLYSCCRTYGYNKLVLAQHLDDLAESFYMSFIHNGQVRTMKANYCIEAGDVRVIRPLIYVRETATRDFSQGSKFPIINENCPACFEEPKERARVKKLLAQEEAMTPALFHNIKRALLPLMHDDVYETINQIVREVELSGASKEKVLSNKRLLSSEASDEIKDATKKTKTTENKSLTNCNDGFCAPCFEIA